MKINLHGATLYGAVIILDKDSLICNGALYRCTIDDSEAPPSAIQGCKLIGCKIKSELKDKE